MAADEAASSDQNPPPDGRSWIGRHRGRVTTAAVVSVAGVSIAALSWLFPREPETREVVPDVVGVLFVDASERLSGEGLVARQELGPEGEPPGTVLSQEPAAGERVRSGSQVVLVVAAPTSTVEVPDVVGLAMEAAATAVGEHGLQLVQAGEEESDSVPPGHVLSQSPAPLTSVAVDSRVEVVVSVEPPDRARIALIDVDVIEAAQTADVVLTVRNDGEQDALITDVLFDVTDVKVATGGPGPLQSSATYEAAIPMDGPGSVRVSVAQKVGPLGHDAVDKFTVRISPDAEVLHRFTFTFTVAAEEASSADIWDEPFTVSLFGGNAVRVEDPGGQLPGKDPAPEPTTPTAAP